MDESLSGFKVEGADGVQIGVERVYPRREVRESFGLCDKQLYRYIQLLQNAVPDEFEYTPNSGCFDEFQYKALRKVRLLILSGMKRQQILNKLRVEGLKLEEIC